ncbi:MAG: deoxyribose-phosphate aldolase [Thermotogota bacterium]
MISKEVERVEKNYKHEYKDINIEPKEIAQMIDHTLLHAYATENDVEKLCQEAKENNFFSVCVNPSMIKISAESLKDSEVKIATVIGFPLGATSSESKVEETKIAINDGADELDMVINIGWLKAKQYDKIFSDIKSVVDASNDKLVKVIIETCYLDKTEKIAACVLSKIAGADFVKTSTGFGTDGAKEEDVSLMKFVVGETLEVKASGGIRDFEKASKMIKSGATRIGASSGIKIING